MPAVAAVAAVMLALIALLLIYGSAAAGRWLAQWFPKSINLGVTSSLAIHPRAWVEAAADAVLSGVKWVLGDLVRPVVGFVVRPVTEFINWLGSVEDFISSAGSTLYWIIRDGIPQALTSAKAWVLTKVAAVEAYAYRLVMSARHYALNLYHRAEAYALSLYHKVEAYAAHLYALAKTYAHGLIAAEEKIRHDADAAVKSYAVSLVKGATSDLSKAINQVEKEVRAITSTSIPDVAKAVAAGVSDAEAYADKVAAGAAGALTAGATAVVAGLFDGLITDVGALQDVIGLDLPDIGAAVRAIPRAVPTDLAGVVALDLAISVPMLRYMERCGIPNCRNLSKVGRDLQNLFGAIEGAGFLALIGYIVADPTGAAHEAEDVLGGTAGELVDAARHLIGV